MKSFSRWSWLGVTLLLSLAAQGAPSPYYFTSRSTAPVVTTRCCAGIDTRLPAASADQPDVTAAIDRNRSHWRRNALLGGYVLGVGVYGFYSWWDKDVQRNRITESGDVVTETVPNRTSDFHVSDEGWFGKDTPNGGADKLGHAFSFYVSTRLMTRALEWAGEERDRAIWTAGLTSAGVSLAVEIMDGYTLEYGFSREDLIMNLAGIGTGMLLEYYPAWDDAIDLRWQYWPSDDARKYGETDPIADYSGQTYLLVAKASGIPRLRDHRWLKYLEFQVGYGSRGYQPTPGPFAPDQPEKSRNFYYGIGLNLSEVLDATVFKGSGSRTQRITDTALEYLQVPGTNLLVEHNIDP